MPAIKVSVIVPCYNAEPYLVRCLDSLVNQTLEEIEIICVNDASPDNGIAILRDYEARYHNLTVIDLKENIRQGGARNRGIQIAKGEYVAFVDADDWVDKNMYLKLYQKAMDLNVDLVSCAFDCVDSDYHVTKREINPTYLQINGIITENQRELLMTLVKCVPWGYLIKKSILIEHQIHYPEQIFYEDNYFGVLLGLYANGYSYVPECLYHYFYNQTSTVRTRNTTHVYDRPKIMKMVLTYFQQQGLTQKYYKILNYLIALNLYLSLKEYLMYRDHPQYSFVKDIGKRLRSYRINRHNPYLLKNLGERWTIAVTVLRYCPKLYWYIWIVSRKLNIYIWP